MRLSRWAMAIVGDRNVVFYISLLSSLFIIVQEINWIATYIQFLIEQEVHWHFILHKEPVNYSLSLTEPALLHYKPKMTTRILCVDRENNGTFVSQLIAPLQVLIYHRSSSLSSSISRNPPPSIQKQHRRRPHSLPRCRISGLLNIHLILPKQRT